MGRNLALDGAWRKGCAAALAGTPRTVNPYEDHRKPSGRLTWSRAFIRAWDDGWCDQGPRPEPPLPRVTTRRRSAP